MHYSFSLSCIIPSCYLALFISLSCIIPSRYLASFHLASFHHVILHYSISYIFVVQGFFVVRLQPTSGEPHEIKDPDPLINCDLMDGRDAFLTLSRDKHYEFSSLRRAKFSTMGLLYELHTQAKDGFIYTCNDCKANVETRYHCSVCDVREPVSAVHSVMSIVNLRSATLRLISTSIIYCCNISNFYTTH